MVACGIETPCFVVASKQLALYSTSKIEEACVKLRLRLHNKERHSIES
ncbi:MAG: hypothetical protein ACJAVV_000245 [Alphaproteobacteria bacterium]|jgi:hypothetical protein